MKKGSCLRYPEVDTSVMIREWQDSFRNQNAIRGNRIILLFSIEKENWSSGHSNMKKGWHSLSPVGWEAEQL